MALKPSSFPGGSMSGVAEIVAGRLMDLGAHAWRVWKARGWSQVELPGGSDLARSVLTLAAASPEARKFRRWVTPESLSAVGLAVGSVSPPGRSPLPEYSYAEIVPSPEGFEFTVESLGLSCKMWVVTEQDHGGDRYPAKSILVLVKGGPEDITRLIAEARRVSASRAEGLVRLLEWRDMGQYWDEVRLHYPRPLESVFLDGESSGLMRDVAVFLDSREWYLRAGQVWKRNYLLHGPPGGGKTSAVHALAGQIGYSICTIRASVSEESFLVAVASMPERAILLVEEVDAMPAARGESTDGVMDRRDVSLSTEALLQITDGMMSRHGLMMFLTTNNAGALSDRLLRSRRIDRKIEFGPATERQVRDAARWYGVDLPDADVAALVGGPVAQAVEYLYRRATERRYSDGME